ncbi:MAG TPA: zf-HC2 domain-containing protein [Bryobacteraceae bacterium]|jgi:hypothetical protein
MNRVEFGEGACEQTRRYLDSYVSNELLTETSHELLRHLETCGACAAELEARTRLRSQLKAAVERQIVPPDLQARVRQRIRSQESRSWASVGKHWAMAMAAAVVVCAGVWFSYSHERMPALTDRPAQDAYIHRVSSTLAAVLKVGLGDHIHCSIFRKYPKNPPAVDEMEANLGPSYKGLLPLVKTAVPEGYRVVMAHQCGYAGRRFIHLTLRDGNDLISLVIARKGPGESLSGLPATIQSSGVSVYQSAAERYQVAGFEAGEYLAFVVSDLRGKTNLQIAADLAPSVHEFLEKTQA